MKVILSLLFLLAAAGRAQDVSDRASITRTIAKLNQTPRPQGLFTEGADASVIDRLDSTAAHEAKVIISHEPLGEARVVFPNSRFISGGIQFITPEVAVADGAFLYTTDGLPQRVTLFFVMKKDGESWRIALIRVAGP